jgi:HK97 family phage major capsid protein
MKKLLIDAKTGKPLNVKELRELRGERVKLMEARAAEFRAAGNSWATPELRAEFEKASDEATFLAEALTVAEREWCAKLESRGIEPVLNGGDDDLRRALARQDGSGRSLPVGEPGLQFRDVASGRVVRALRSHEPIAQRQRKLSSEDTGDGDGEQAEPFSVGRALQALLLNDRSVLNDGEQRALFGGQDDAGGYLLTSALASQVLDLARAASVCMRAGALTVPMESSELRLARLTADPTTSWRAETVRVPASNPSFDQITLRARTCAAVVPISLEAIEDCANVASILEQSLRGAMGSALDKACLIGSGVGAEPGGIVNATGTNGQSAIGTPASYAKYSAAVGDILAANYAGELSDLAWILNPADAEVLDNLAETGTGAPLAKTPWTAAPKQLITSGLTVGTSIIGHFPSLVVGMRSRGVQIRVLDAGSATDSDSVTWNAADQLLKLVVVRMRLDVAIMRPSWFSVLSGLTTT